MCLRAYTRATVHRALVALCVLLILTLGAAGAGYAWLSSDQVRVTIERQATAALGMPVTVGRARARVYPRIGVDLHDVQVGAPAFLTLSRVVVSSELVPLLSRRIEGAEVRIADTTLSLPLPVALPFPATTGEAASPGSRPALAAVSVAAVALENVTVVSLGREVTLSADAGLAGGRLDIARLTATAGRTTLTARGQVTLGTRVAATFDAEASQLDFDDLLALVHAFRLDGTSAPAARGEVGSNGPPASLSLRLTTPVARVAGLEGRNLTTTITTDGNALAVDPLAFTAFGGSLKAAVRLKVGTPISGQIRVMATGLDVAQLATWGGAADTISGRLSGTGTFSGQGKDVESLLATVRGTGRMEIVQGALPGLEFPREALLAIGRPADQAPPPNGGAFDRMSAAFSVSNGRLWSEALSLISRDVEVRAAGSLILASEALDMQGTLRLSEALTVLAGDTLARLAGGSGRIELPATVTGTLQNPRPRVDAAALIKQGIRGGVTSLKKEVKERVLEKLTPLRDLTVPKPNRTF